MWAAVVSFALFGASGEERLDFDRDVRPILADACFRCHGPDAGARKARLRLDLAEGLFEEREDGAVVRPGASAESLLARRVGAADVEERMPPAEMKRQLAPREIALLTRWIDEGARWQPHWAFAPIVAAPPPPVRDEAWCHNEIDRFVLAGLERRGLFPARDADAATLARRVTFALTGLPPTERELSRALADAGGRALDALIDEQLASPHYGEAQALEWLDLARFADTYGYQNDVERDLSPWRDWVVSAINRGESYERFALLQLAGDLLPGASSDDQLATTFLRLHRMTNEGGSIDEEWRAEYVADRVQTFGTAFLGLSLECARCHDHKYDPLKQSDFYSFAAFFNSIDESGLYSHFTQAVPTPALELFRPGEEQRSAELARQVSGLEARRTLLESELCAELDPPATVARPIPLAAFALDAFADGRTENRVDPAQPASAGVAPRAVPGAIGAALEFDGDEPLNIPGVGAFHREDPFTLALWIRPPPEGSGERAVIAHASRASSDAGSRGWQLLLEDGRPSFSLVHFWPGNALSVRAREQLAPGVWQHLAARYDGSSRAQGVELSLQGRPLELEVVRDGLTRDILHRAEWGDGEVGGVWLQLGARFRDHGFARGALDEVELFDRALDAAELALLAGRAPAAAELLEHAVRSDERWLALQTEVHVARSEERALRDGVRQIMAMHEEPAPRPTHVLERGAYDRPLAPVERGAPAFLGAWPADAPRDRLGLARWLAAETNPLFARVAVNRAWRRVFGRGLVATPEDFGTQGARPSHPELLDWLAHWFRAQGFDQRALLRLLLASHTFRQSSAERPELTELDPDNALLGRGPRRRLLAEEVRDGALAASGLLVRQVGGPSVKPYQPSGLWEEAGTGKVYVQDHGEALWRRSLYTFWRRTSPPPAMLVFDAPTREVCRARRSETRTPLQSLALENDPQFVEAARSLAQELVARCGDDVASAIDHAVRRVLSRPSRSLERRALESLHRDLALHFQADPSAAGALLAVGEAPRAPELAAPELAAMTLVVSALFNLSEFVELR